MSKRLYLSKNNKIIAGVCGGLGEYFDLDPIFVRIVLVLSFFVHGFGLFAYIVAWILMPKQDVVAGSSAEVEPEPSISNNNTWHSLLPGILLVVLGAFLLLYEYVWWFEFGMLWPVILIAMGVALILYKGTRKQYNENSSAENVNNNGFANGNNGGTL